MSTPLNPTTILFARHAQHVVLVHFPIALFIAGAVLDLLSRGKRDSQFAAAAYINLTGAALAVLPTIVTGLLAWRFALEGQKLKGLLLLHLIGGSVSSAFILSVWWVHRRARRMDGNLPAHRLFLEILGVALIAFTAHLGGWISGLNG
jgi:uncharacterized membrane protein